MFRYRLNSSIIKCLIRNPKQAKQWSQSASTDANVFDVIESDQRFMQDRKQFATRFRRSKFVQLGDFSGRIVVGKIVRRVGDDLYIDMGMKFNAVCRAPVVKNERYAVGAEVVVRLHDPELSSLFLGSTKELTILEADATLIGLYSTQYESKKTAEFASLLDKKCFDCLLVITNGCASVITNELHRLKNVAACQDISREFEALSGRWDNEPPPMGSPDEELGPLDGTDARRRYFSSERTESIVPTAGREGVSIAPKFYKGRSMGVFTSGGDAPGMNSAVRSVVRMGLYLGCHVFCIYEGYQGMVDGGENIKEAEWDSVSDIIQKGGTIIGSARCKEFQQRSGRLSAAENLIKHGIINLVCIGGDGSLTGANLFRQEWPELVTELLKSGKITKDQAVSCANIQIVGLVGSIDNDFCGTDMTIGTDTALQRIIEAIDCVLSTAQSHQRTFVIEVMGRHCGYLALVAALASEADFCFIPEWPVPVEWPVVLCRKLQLMRDAGSRLNIIIVAEGAVDREGKVISAEMVRSVVKQKLHYDTRVTVLGHVQRGGNPSAFDRLLGCRMGAEAVLALMEMTIDSEPCVVSIDGNTIVRVPLMQCVQRTQAVKEAMDKHDWITAVKFRGRSFQRNLETYRLLNKIEPKKEAVDSPSFNLAVMNVGAPAGGMNAVVRCYVRMAIYNHCKVYAVRNSFEGLVKGDLKEMSWSDVSNWVMHGGSFLGTKKQLPDGMMDQVAAVFEKLNIHGLLIVGGFEAFHSCLLLTRARSKYPSLRIPMCVIPCTISNNVPGTSLSLGSDTAVNEICQMIDKIKQSAIGTKKRVFIVETMGGYCGYLATVSALASGADNAYIFEESFNVNDICDDVRVLTHKMKMGVQRYLIVRCEMANKNYTTQFVNQLFCEESKGAFTTRINVLGHAQQGGNPTPFDRNLGTKLASRALEYILELAKEHIDPVTRKMSANASHTAVLLGLRGRRLVFTPVEDLVSEADFEHRLPKEQWWLKIRPLLRILSKHDSIYETEAMAVREVVGDID